MSVRTVRDQLREPHTLRREERWKRLRELEAEGVDLSLLAEQLRLSPTARIESMLRLNRLCTALVEASKRSEDTRSEHEGS
jgi:hypothetical protein